MITHRPGAIRVAALLVSASCGIAFLLGSGEMAIRSGMAGSLYAIVTAFGMFALGLIAPKLWHAAEPIWQTLGNRYGLAVRRTVALLSLVWMTGVLAAQIHGSVAVLSIAGFSICHSMIFIAVALLVISSVDLGVAALFFAVCLLASNLILLRTLVASGGLGIYLYAWPAFIREVQAAAPVETLAAAIAIGFLVITGSDYHQFVIAARRPVDARLGCVLAGFFLIGVGFLPAATVLAALHNGNLSDLADYAGAIPWIMLHSSGRVGALCLYVIVLAALGSGTALTRAMSSALMDLPPFTSRHTSISRCLVVAASSAIAIDGQPIVSTIISLNTIYISSVGILYLLDQLGHPVTPRCAFIMMICGALFSFFTALLSWAQIARMPSWTSLASGLLASASLRLAWYLIFDRRGVRP